MAPAIVALATQAFKPVWDKYVDERLGLGSYFEALVFAALLTRAVAAAVGIYAHAATWQGVILEVFNDIVLAWMAGGVFEKGKRDFIKPIADAAAAVAPLTPPSEAGSVPASSNATAPAAGEAPRQ